MMRALIAALLLAGCATAAPSPATPPPAGAEAIGFDGRALTRPALPETFIAEQEALLAQARAIDTPQHPQQMADAAIWIGRRLGYLGRYREAIAAFEDGAARFPEDPRFLRHLGHRFITVRQLDDAITTLTRAEAMTAHRPDEIEPDGLPNTANTPTSTLKGNIAYHLGLAYYLRGDFPTAARVFQGAAAMAANADAAVAARYWLYLALARSGNLQAAKAALAPIQPDWPVHEESAYFWLTLCFNGQGACDAAEEGAPAPQSAAIAYGLAAQALIEGRRTEAHAGMRAILARSDWASFGYIAAEADLAR